MTGPSGVGKSTILRDVLAQTGARFSISVTTRQPRTGEVDHEHYHFVDRPTFEGMVANGEMLEWAEVFGRLYGTPAAPVLEAIEAGETIVLDVELRGARQVHAKCPQATFVLIAPPDPDVLRQRLIARGTEDTDAVEQRLARAKEELDEAQASGLYEHTITNDELASAVQRLIRIVT